jgi:hypothetical protein
LNLPFRLLSDPQQQVARKYAANDRSGYLRRVVYVVGPDGKVTYRNLNKITTPNLKKVYARDLFENLQQLMQPTLEQKNISMEIILMDTDLTLAVDINLVEQADPHVVAIFGGDHIYRMNMSSMIEYHQQKSEGRSGKRRTQPAKPVSFRLLYNHRITLRH